ncbi:MAG: photosystem II assembly protein Psb35 [Nostoc sp. DedVER02]|jgi:hypothetical protein|uniref:photosystem II assembly protein Psb35 n=1 Tax=Nostoc TaxID=1177 RepID=UPI001E2AC7F8|nr:MULTISPECIES: hypothetical protein [Nostoc]MCC5665700.1 hypothetical protein [Nostoc mirabile CHAB5784]MDZ7986194.1 hypothetical protein [Nostoc sp. DedVER02]MDZ8114998.1 hypothetical protein [Nostoc sp. DedVER01b]MDZ8124446.1 hypothetical protein [Nostoc sp. CmiVER01]MDZ8223536.1 hypothetical protein [Nostoc sp. ChiVER01]
MHILMQAADSVATGGGQFPFAFTLVYVVGFIAAVTIGSIAWYNSKRPAGWESKERPDFVPKVDKEETPGLGDPKS